MYILQARDVVKRYSNHLALDRVSISVPRGTVFGLLGPNGAGKTTLIRIINQITGPDEGEVLFNGEPLRKHHIERIGYLPEERGLYKKMKAGEQALYLARLKGLTQQDALTQLKYWFEKFEIQSWWNRKVEELSKGMQQKIQFIVTILHKPDLLIFDEPFSGFDPINVDLLKNEILSLKASGTTIIFSTHNMASVEELCDNIALIHRSKVLLEGRVDDIRKRNSRNLFEIETTAGLQQLSAHLPRNASVVSTTDKGMVHIHTLSLHNGSQPQEILMALLPVMHITGFREVLPSMHDIFVNSVKETRPEEIPA